MNTFLTKLVMLIFFIVAVSAGWAAVTMVFQASLWNIILGVVSAFFLFRALELADRINKYGQYAEKEEGTGNPNPPEEK